MIYALSCCFEEDGGLNVCGFRHIGSSYRFSHGSWVIRATFCKFIVLAQNHDLSLIVKPISIFSLLFVSLIWLRVDQFVLDIAFFWLTVFAVKVVGPSKLFGHKGIPAHIGVFMHYSACGLRFYVFWLLLTLVLIFLSLTDSSKFRRLHQIAHFLNPLS